MDSTGSGQAAGLRVGVTGHRATRLRVEDLGSLAQAAAAALAVLDQVSRERGRGPNTLVTCMADGADAILADAALAAGWRLDAVLPFPRAAYREDFAAADAERLDRQLARSARVFELPGCPDEPEARAYERAGSVMLAQIDLLIGIWDGSPGRGPGGTAQVINEALARDLPALMLDPGGERPVEVAWLRDGDFGLAGVSIEDVPRYGVERLAEIAARLLDASGPPVPTVVAAPARRPLFATAYPLFLRAVTFGRDLAPSQGTGARVEPLPVPLQPLFDGADATAVASAEIYRSGFVLNFGLAAIAVLLAMIGLMLPDRVKPPLILMEALTIFAILLITQIGSRRNWHGRWIDHRHLAERLRCLGVSVPLGDLDLRDRARDGAGWADGRAGAAARDVGLPDAVVDAPYLQRIRASLLALLDHQIGYLTANERTAHIVERRLQRLSTILFVTTAVLLALLFCYRLAMMMAAVPRAPAGVEHDVIVGVTMVSAAFPALGAALYGIRLQGDFAGTGRRDGELGSRLRGVRGEVATNQPSFDRLRWQARHVTDLLTADLASWSRTGRTVMGLRPGSERDGTNAA